MMKKTLFLLSALLLAGIGAKAQTVVVHECEAVIDDWSINNGITDANFRQNTWSTEADASGMTTPFIEYWVGSGSILPDATISHTALTELETGYYEVSIFARAFNENSTTAVSQGITFTANDESVDLTEGTAGEFDSASEEDYGVYELLVLVENGTLNIGFTVSGLTACDWLAFKNLEVTYLGTSPVGYVAHECEAYGDDWAKPAHWTADYTSVTYGDFHVNKHSTEADPSGMVTPFIEYWVASGSNLSNNVLRHDQLTGLYPGNYEVSIDVRAFNESGSTAITSGTTFNANDASVDITNAGLNVSTEYSGHYELYGTLNLIATVTAAQGGDTGTLDIDFTVSGANYNWLAFKNLKVVYDGEDMPTLTYVTGDMNSAVETAMQAAVDAYNTNKTSDNYTVALAAIAAAEESVAQYAEVAALVAALDSDGTTAWASTTSGSAYSNHTLTTSDDISEDMAAAQKAQTTEGTDWSYVLKNTGTWMKDGECGVINFQNYGTTAHEAWSSSDFTASETHPRKPLYKMIEDLPAGEYEISFYTYAAQGTTSLTNDILAFANEASTTVDFDDLSYGPSWSEENGLCTLTCNVNVEGVLRFGMESTGKGAWYVMEEGSLKLVSLATEEATDTDSDYKKGETATIDGTIYTIQSENMVDNHSFELGFEGWTDAATTTGQNTITSEYFELRSGSNGDAKDGNVYLVGATNNGADSEGSLCKVWEIGAGKTYYFSYYVKGLTDATSGAYLMTAVTNTIGADYDVDTSTDAADAHLLHNFSGETIGTDWQKVEIVFTNGETSAADCYTYLQAHFRWLDNQWAFDNFQLYEIEEATEIEWTLGADYGTLILPFAYDLSSTSLTAYTGTINGTEMELTEVSDNAITAYTPYIIGGAEEAQTTYYFSGVPGTNTETSFTDDSSGLTGVLVDTYAPANSYVLQKQDDEPAFYLVENDDEILVGAYHCYLSENAVPANAKAVRLVFDDVATAIEAVEATEETGSETIYDLSGRRVAKAQKGVYIVNGKKMVIK